MPETHVPFGRYEADFVWREQKVIVKLDSGTYHSGPGVVRRWDVVYEPVRVAVLLAEALAGGLRGL